MKLKWSLIDLNYWTVCSQLYRCRFLQPSIHFQHYIFRGLQDTYILHPQDRLSIIETSSFALENWSYTLSSESIIICEDWQLSFHPPRHTLTRIHTHTTLDDPSLAVRRRSPWPLQYVLRFRFLNSFWNVQKKMFPSQPTLNCISKGVSSIIF